MYDSDTFFIILCIWYYNCNNGIEICISNTFVCCPTVGYYNGSECCPSDKCRSCNLETETCLECQPGFIGLQCEQGNINQI